MCRAHSCPERSSVVDESNLGLAKSGAVSKAVVCARSVVNYIVRVCRIGRVSLSARAGWVTHRVTHWLHSLKSGYADADQEALQSQHLFPFWVALAPFALLTCVR
jgi:hypothetical protein